MKKICILTCGGTITMRRDKEGVLRPYKKVADFLEEFPELESVASISVINLVNIDSSNMDPSIWIKITERIKEQYDLYDGFVIVHGTDTMAYSASAISYTLQNLSKPIIFTGAQKPLTDLASDARNNLINAVIVATMPLPEVAIVFGARILRGNRSTKISESSFNAFKSPIYPPLGVIGLKPELNTLVIRNRNDQKTNFSAHFNPNVFILKMHPGFNPQLIKKLFEQDCQGVILEAFGAGNIPDNVVPFVKIASQKEIPVIILSQCHQGITKMQLYYVGSKVLKEGAIAGRDMTTEAAVTKLMWCLGKTQKIEDIRAIFNQDFAGEITLTN